MDSERDSKAAISADEPEIDQLYHMTSKSSISSSSKESDYKDEAFKFVADHNLDSYEEGDLVYTKEITRKIDLRVVTILSLVYFLQFLDKTLLNYAAVMGIKKNLVGNQFSNLATMFYGAYIFGEPISVFLLQKCPPAKLLGVYVIIWGIIVACHAACKTYASLMIVRTLLGLFESLVVPALISVSVMWYDKKQQVRRMGIWCIQSGTATTVGGFLSFCFQHVENKKFQSWQAFFLMMGLITIIAGILVLFILPDNPTSAKFLTEKEKLIHLQHIKKNQTGTETKHFKKAQLIELLFHDKHTWPMLFVTVLTMCATGALGTFSVTIISNFGFTPKVSALVQMPIGVAIVIMILCSTYIDSVTNQRAYVFISLVVPSIIGYILLLVYRGHSHKVAQVMGLYLIESSTCAITLIYAWNGANTGGYTKSISRNCLTMIFFALGNLIGPQMFKAKDAPDYIPAKIALLVTTACSIPVILLVRYISVKENAKRDNNIATEKEMPNNYEFMDFTDIQNSKFRYSY